MRVSCLMVTMPVPDRLEPMKCAIDAYARQTYANRELIIVMDQGRSQDRHAAMEAINAFSRDDITVLAPTEKLTLGALRNLTVEMARGDVLCQWDDDDLHHPCRIAEQIAAPLRGDCAATFLQEVMLYDRPAHSLYWTNWAATPATAHPGTLLCIRNAMQRYPESGPDALLNEDLVLLQNLRAKHGMLALPGAPHLYVYVTHGTNISPPAHLEMLRDRLSISRALLQRREASLRKELSGFALEGVEVVGSNGPVFTL